MRLLLTFVLAQVLGAQSVDLSGEWRRMNGDDPRYAAADFDDSQWARYRLPHVGRLTPQVFWLRRTVTEVNGNEACSGLGSLADCYTVYRNGKPVANNGCQAGSVPKFNRPAAYAMPAEPGPWVLAIRCERASLTWGAAGDLRDEGPYLLSDALAVANAVRGARTSGAYAMTPVTLTAWTQIVLGIALLWLWLNRRERHELWLLAGFLFSISAYNLANVAMGSGMDIPHVTLPLGIGYLFLLALTHRLLRGSWPSVRFTGLLVLLMMGWVVGDVFSRPRLFIFAPLPPAILWSFQALWRGTREQRAFAIAFLLYMVWTVLASVRVLTGVDPPTSFYAGPWMFWVSSIVSAFASAVFTLVLLARLSADGREKTRLASELEAARGVQRLLLAGQRDTAPWGIEPVYLPATEVGGDFYFVEPVQEGGVLVVVGDVSGKGLKAAMVVSLLTGALRNRRSDEPAESLTELNRASFAALDGGFVTALAVRIGDDGAARIANAGHLAPYFGGREIEIAGGLPLGLDAGAEYEATAVSLRAGEQLTLVSDGVVEAASAVGELFGFARTAAMAGKPAKEIAEAARAWGQNDDITVVTIRRAAV